jgi:hypothetical protein
LCSEIIDDRWQIKDVGLMMDGTARPPLFLSVVGREMKK